MHFRQGLAALSLLIGCALSQSSYAFNHDDHQLIEDPNFLFRPLTKPVQMDTLSDVIWDDSRFWRACDYRDTA